MVNSIHICANHGKPHHPVHQRSTLRNTQHPLTSKTHPSETHPFHDTWTLALFKFGIKLANNSQQIYLDVNCYGVTFPFLSPQLVISLSDHRRFCSSSSSFSTPYFSLYPPTLSSMKMAIVLNFQNSFNHPLFLHSTLTLLLFLHPVFHRIVVFAMVDCKLPRHKLGSWMWTFPNFAEIFMGNLVNWARAVFCPFSVSR